MSAPPPCVPICWHTSVCLFACLCAFLSACLPRSLAAACMPGSYLPVLLYACLFVCLTHCLVCLPASQPARLFDSLLACLPAFSPANPPVLQSVLLSSCLSIGKTQQLTDGFFVVCFCLYSDLCVCGTVLLLVCTRICSYTRRSVCVCVPCFPA